MMTRFRDLHAGRRPGSTGAAAKALRSPDRIAPARAFDLAADDDEILAEDQVIGDRAALGGREGQDDCSNRKRRREITTPSAYHAAFLAQSGSGVRTGTSRRKIGRSASRTEAFAPTARSDARESCCSARGWEAPRLFLVPYPCFKVADLKQKNGCL